MIRRLSRTVLPVGLGGLVAGLGWRRGALTGDGALAASAVGAATFGFGGWPASLGLIAFFVSGSALSRRRGMKGEVASAKGHQRDALQVLANGGSAALALALGGVGWRRARGAALGALAAAAADTWASEIGVRSPTPPRSILSGVVVRPGMSGGVTPLGWGAAAGGAMLVGGVWGLAGERWARAMIVALVAGLCGSMADSLAGATIQASYRCDVCGEPSEGPSVHCGRPMRLVRGYRWITNDVVNAIGTGAGALMGAALDGVR